MDISKLKLNPKNPRIIKDDKFQKLVKSIQEFPEMLEKRPIVCVTDAVDGKLFPLGGNMRLKALKELKFKEVPDSWISIADDWTEEKRAEFTIKDNVSFGDWNFEELTMDWDGDLLADWGLDGFNWSAGVEENSMTDEDVEDMLDEEFDPIGSASEVQRVVFIFLNKEDAETYLSKNKIQFTKRNMAWQVNMSTQSI